MHHDVWILYVASYESSMHTMPYESNIVRMLIVLLEYLSSSTMNTVVLL